MTLLVNVQGVVDEIQGDAELNALRFRLSGTWTGGVACRYSVKDPNKGSASKGPLNLETDPIPASLRLVKVWPGDLEPQPGASIAHQGGLLVLGVWTDRSVWTDSRAAVCRLVDARAYPITATAGGAPFLIRIVALSAAAEATASGNDLSAIAQGSHRALLPPGITLQPTDVITTGAGDQYRVVPPVQRDVLGDTLGLSWLGTETGRTPTPGNDPTPETPPTTPPDVDPWWEQMS